MLDPFPVLVCVSGSAFAQTCMYCVCVYLSFIVLTVWTHVPWVPCLFGVCIVSQPRSINLFYDILVTRFTDCLLTYGANPYFVNNCTSIFLCCVHTFNIANLLVLRWSKLSLLTYLFETARLRKNMINLLPPLNCFLSLSSLCHYLQVENYSLRPSFVWFPFFLHQITIIIIFWEILHDFRFIASHIGDGRRILWCIQCMVSPRKLVNGGSKHFYF